MIIFDLETTGVDNTLDRAVSIAYVITGVNGEILEEFYSLINPEMPIPPKSTEVHGITDEMVKDAPTFKDLAPTLKLKFTNRTVGGYNSNRFDIPVLITEFARAGINWRPSATVDLLQALRKIYPMDLSSVYRRVLGLELEGAHNAMNDVKATRDLIKTFSESGHDLPALGSSSEIYDWGGKFRLNSEGRVEFAFGKYMGQEVKATQDHIGFLEWMLQRQFHPDTIAKVRLMINTFRERLAKQTSKSV